MPGPFRRGRLRAPVRPGATLLARAPRGDAERRRCPAAPQFPERSGTETDAGAAKTMRPFRGVSRDGQDHDYERYGRRTGSSAAPGCFRNRRTTLPGALRMDLRLLPAHPPFARRGRGRPPDDVPERLPEPRTRARALGPARHGSCGSRVTSALSGSAPPDAAAGSSASRTSQCSKRRSRRRIAHTKL